MRGGDFFDSFDELVRFITGARGEGERAGIRHHGTWYPGIDVYEIETGLIVVAELPGVKKENIEITLEENLLKISGKRFEPVYNFVKCHHREILYGKFERVVRLPGECNLEGIKAELRDGLLLIFLPGREAEVKKITIE